MRLSTDRLKVVVPVWSLLLLIAISILYGTSPDRIGPQGVTGFFVVLYFLAAFTVQVLMLGVRRLIVRPGAFLLGWKFSYALVVAFLPIAVLGLSSLDQLILRDLLIFLGLAGLLVFYVSKSGQK